MIKKQLTKLGIKISGITLGLAIATAAPTYATHIGTNDLADGAVTSAKIATNTIQSSNLAKDSVGSSEIKAGAVGTDELAAGAVYGGNIKNGTIRTIDVADGGLTGDDIGPSAKIVLSPTFDDDNSHQAVEADANLVDYAGS